ncbi:hypothetical protein SLH49_07675 [Cognatiyoonia sp. IB215446]|uniref:hypothetical protein n=1 Tax=Cognatiyoonia sp. IB215446 TaxID=3097355 RepID=UPI002A0BB66D|nr:hypothetical protein [Cognatiyoonia sp. IB215446]MDX8347861.1 hypothetical protein [Cognatiyoonia sp. IB215446]
MSEPEKHVTIRRLRGFFGVLRPLRVGVDGQEIVQLKHGQEMQTALPAGAQMLTLRMGWTEADPFPLQDVHDGDTLVISVERKTALEMRKLKTLPFALRIVRP